MKPNGTFNSDVYYNDNFNVNYTNLDLATVELFKGYPDGLLKFATACCILFMLIGIPGNIITIAALARYKKVRNATALFIINLSCSDLMFCCFNFPLSASTFWQRSWTHGHILCRIFPFVRYTAVIVSALTILTITLNRYVMIAHPRVYSKIFKPRNIGIIIASIWIFTVGGFIPTWFEKFGRFRLDPSVGSCSILPDEKGRSPKKVLIVGFFIIPLVVIILCYARMFFIVRKATKKSLLTNKTEQKGDESSGDLSTSQYLRVPTTDPNCTYVSENEDSSISLNSDMRRNVSFNTVIKPIPENCTTNRSGLMQLRRTVLRKSKAFLKLSLPTRKDRRLGTMIIAIMISFSACHLPITITKVFINTSLNANLCIAAYILLFLSSSINPIIYVVMSQEYRKAYKYLLKRRRRSSLTLKGTQHQT